MCVGQTSLLKLFPLKKYFMTRGLKTNNFWCSIKLFKKFKDRYILRSTIPKKEQNIWIENHCYLDWFLTFDIALFFSKTIAFYSFQRWIFNPNQSSRG